MPTVHISEHTERPEFIDHLKQKLGLQFRVFQELVKDSQKEDITIFRSDAITIDFKKNTINWDSNDAVVAIIETKIKEASNLEQHEPQLAKYIQEFKCPLGFITNYSNLIYYSYTPEFSILDKSTYYSDQMGAVAEYVAKAIEKSTKITIQKTPEEIIKILEESINFLMKYTSRVKGTTWEKILRFSDEPEREAKEKELSAEEKIERDTFFQRSAAYIAITQLLFYNVFRMYRINQGSKTPKLRPLSISNGIPTQIQEIISDVPNNNLNFKAIFGKNKDVFSKLDDEAAAVLSGIIQILEGIDAPFVIGNDLIGQIFQRLMPFEVRKKFAAFYTLHKAAELLCSLAIKNSDSTVYDPACGSGTLLVYAYHRKKELGLKQHKQLLEQIKGSDISDIATMMSTVNLAIQDPSKWTNEVSIYPHDAFALISGLTRFYSSTQETPDGRKKVSPIFAPDKDYRVDVLLANPPFTRGARLSKTTREVLGNLELVQKYKIKPNFSAMNLYTFFLLIAPTLVKGKDGNGIIAFILPQGAINSKVMIPIWQVIFQEHFGLKILVEASDLDESFSDSEDQEILVVLERNYDGPARLVKLIGELNKKNIGHLIQEIESTESPFEKLPDCVVQLISQKEIQDKTCTEWRINPSKSLILLYKQFLPLDKNELEENAKTQYDRDLSDVIEIVVENFSRPAEYWFIPNKYWEIESLGAKQVVLKATSENIVISSDPSESHTLSIPRESLIPAMASSMKKYRNYPPIIPPDIVDNFLINYKSELTKEFKKYYEWGQKAHKIGLFGSDHSGRTPFRNGCGILKKIDYTNTKTLALRFVEPLVGRRIITVGFLSKSEEVNDLMFAYLTSSLFLLDSLEKSRSRRAEFIIMYKTDFLRLFRFPDFPELQKKYENKHLILDASKDYNGMTPLKDRPTFSESIRRARIDYNYPLRKLDDAWFKALNLPIEYLDVFYQEIMERLREMDEK